MEQFLTTYFSIVLPWGSSFC